ncbi:MAG TPA: cyclopropane-fatty-acyl-phospholipid synthase family protein [Candidatus Eisenbacteria bacterium]|nr:cyclopropane-fatty-acyl-phospholipid synthase family protein [Candidatus Eisenbacteria bacterium]
MSTRAESRFSKSLVLKLLEPMNLGRLEMTLPSGQTRVYGSDAARGRARVVVRSDDFFRKCALYGDVGFGEAYVDGDWDTDDVTAVISWMILNVENHPTLMGSRPKRAFVNFLRALNNLRHRLRPNTESGSRKNIAAHYDLSNDFFALFLDPTMTYSCAMFGADAGTLEAAQRRKFDELCSKLRVRAGDRVLEIGCGWGGFAVHAAKNYGCRVTGITVSSEQFEYARRRVSEEGLSDRVEIRLVDYRRLEGRFDKIVSIEMIEAVGHEFLDAYFLQCHRLLKKDGVLAIQGILAPDARYESFRKNSDWIQKHIFPGGLLPSFEAILAAVRRTGDLGLHDYEDLSPDYARTLARWRDNLNARRADALTMGFDEAFLRKWNYYFSYCEGAFRMRNIGIAQMIFSRPNNPGLG